MSATCFLKQLFFAHLLVLVTLNEGLVEAEEVESPPVQAKDNNSPAYPGEEIATKDGKKVRRWSTRGPVEVSPPPQPFDQVDQQRHPGGLLLNLQDRTTQRYDPHNHLPLKNEDLRLKENYKKPSLSQID